jgi:hypothetical protein
MYCWDNVDMDHNDVVEHPFEISENLAKERGMSQAVSHPHLIVT